MDSLIRVNPIGKNKLGITKIGILKLELNYYWAIILSRGLGEPVACNITTLPLSYLCLAWNQGRIYMPLLAQLSNCMFFLYFKHASLTMDAHYGRLSFGQQKLSLVTLGQLASSMIRLVCFAQCTS